MSTATALSHAHPARIRTVTLDHPWRWLALGWRDARATPAVSLAWGALFAVAGFLLLVGLQAAGLDYLIVPLGLGFALVGPLTAVGLYEVSRRRRAGATTSLVQSLAGARRNTGQLALLGGMLMLAFIAWVRLAMLEFMLFFAASPPPLDGLYHAVLTSDRGAAFLLVGGATGGALAALVFAMSAVAVPMLIDRPHCDAVTAMLTSVEACRRNWIAMVLWAFLVALTTLAGLTLFFAGLVVALPVIGHASWHAYKDLVATDS